MLPARLSILWRLTFSNAAIMALVLAAFVMAGWLTLTRVVAERANSVVSETVQVVASAVRAERKALAQRGEVEESRGSTEQAVLSGLRAGNLDIYITDDAAHLMAARQPLYPPDPASETQSDAQSSILPDPVRELLRNMLDGRDPEMERVLKTPDGVSVRSVELTEGPARVALMRVLPEEYDDPDEPILLITALRPGAGDMLILKQVRNTLLLATPLALLVSVLAGFIIARRSLAPLEAINTRTASITAANLDERLPVTNPHDELGRLAGIINGLLSRVDLAFRNQRQLVADASHELRTPIAIIRGEADVTMRRSTRDEHEYREALTVIQGESSRLTRIVDDLFLLARVDAAGPTVSSEEVDIYELAADAVRSVRSIALDQSVNIECMLADGIDPGLPDVAVTGDSNLLRRLVVNLLDNALKHSPRDSTVQVRVSRSDSEIVLRVGDQGPGVPESIKSSLFGRFVHEAHAGKDTASSATGTGAGLGLSIAQAIARAHGGTIDLLDTATAQDTGAVFELRLPARSARQPHQAASARGVQAP